MFRKLVVDIKKLMGFKASFRQFKRLNMLKMCFQNSVNEKHLSAITFQHAKTVETVQQENSYWKARMMSMLCSVSYWQFS